MSRRTVYRYIDTFRDAGFAVRKSGACIRLDKESPHFREISQLVHFTEEEAVIPRRAIESIDDTNLLKQNLKRKLCTVYDNKTLAQTVVRGRQAPNIHALIEAIRVAAPGVQCGYRSAHGGAVRDRLVEPFAFTTNYVQVWCHDPEARGCASSSRRPVSGAWNSPASRGALRRRIARGSSTSSACTARAANASASKWAYGHSLLVEGYPLAERDVRPAGCGRWLLDTEVAGYAGVGRFVAGCLDDVRVVDSPGLVSYLR